jgi:hypothetical protein
MCARAVEMSFSSTFSAAVGATELLRGWNVAHKLARLAISNVAERGIGSRGHALAVGPSQCLGNCDCVLQFIKGTGSRIQTTCDIACASFALPWDIHTI